MVSFCRLIKRRQCHPKNFCWLSALHQQVSTRFGYLSSRSFHWSVQSFYLLIKWFVGPSVGCLDCCLVDWLVESWCATGPSWFWAPSAGDQYWLCSGRRLTQQYNRRSKTTSQFLIDLVQQSPKVRVIPPRPY